MAAGKRRRGKSEAPSGKKLVRSKQQAPLPARPVLEEAAGETPDPEEAGCFVVGVGASAGGLEAFTQLLRALPADTGMAFVLVQHLLPTHESALAEILSRSTGMPVTEVADEPQVEPNHVYVIPPDRGMVIARGHLRLLPRELKGKHHPIDRFFRSLAENQRHRAIGVILSGTATDGTLGLEEIKAAGGITFAQDDTARHPGMPRSAVASGCVDFVLPPEAIAAEIARIGAHPCVSTRPGDQEGQDRKSEASARPETIAPILNALRQATGVDFSQYKKNTLLRRIKRRMVLKKKLEFEEYAEHLRASPDEAEALYQDILINVTGFFRNPEMFEVLGSKVLPALLEETSPQNPLRLWVLGCSTGEEAYSLAMMVVEAQDLSNREAPAQIFATDLNANAIQHARAGFYAKERLEGMSRGRLRRFFVELPGSYRVAKPIRDLCVFSRHDVMVDPPFSRMDLVSCRNLLIYLEPSLQQRVIRLLHYALKPSGFLVLGASETVGRFTDLFAAKDAKQRIFQKKPGPPRLPVMPMLQRKPGTDPALPAKEMPSSAAVPEPAHLTALGLTDVHREASRLLAAFAPPAVLVDADLEVLEFLGNTEPYLAHVQGKASLALLRMAREGLLVPLQALLERAKKENAPVSEEGVQVRSTEGLLEVDLEVLPVKRNLPSGGCFLVIFSRAPAPGEGRAAAAKRPRRAKPVQRDAELEAARTRIAHLEHELMSTREYLQVQIEQHEASNEELQSVNEEAQSANEELQSINEELETSKEEIESSNEELITVNDELHSRNLEINQLNNDLTNLISSVQLAILIVGRDLRIRRLSPMAEKLLNVIATDVGRPIHDIRMKIVLPELESLLEEVIDTAIPREVEVQDKQERWWSLRMRPYLTSDSKIDGAVLMLVDIDALKKSEQAITRARDYLSKWEYIFNQAGWAVATMQGDTDALELVNPAFAQMHGYTVEQLVGRPLAVTLAPEARDEHPQYSPGPRKQGGYVYESMHVRKDGTRFPVLTQVTFLKDKDGNALYGAATFQDITERKRLEMDLASRNEELAAADSAKSQFIAVLSHELRSPLNVILLWAHILLRTGRSEKELEKGLEIIVRSSKVQAQLIEDLMDIHRIGYGRVKLDLTELDLGTLVEAAVDAIAPEAAIQGILVERELDPLPAVVLGDQARLGQVLRNLLDNALKFTPKGGRIRVSQRRRGLRVELSVSDTGQGISAEALPRIFERFRQPDPLLNPSRGGLGLGLSIAKHLVELHEGSIAAESAGRGQGATFTVTLPVLAAREARPRVLAGPARADGPARLGGTMVLVVDDDPDQREPVRRVLEQAGAETVAVASADEALHALQQGLPDVIVSDIRMPGRDGYELLRAVRALPRKQGGQVPAIALTAYVSAEDLSRALSAGFQAHLAKPVDPSRLIAAVAELATPRPAE